ncbi:MAG: hypothetical protein WC709_11955 [Thermoleophilia bacterium]
MAQTEDRRRRSRQGAPARDLGADPYLKSMLLGLIEDSYLHTGTLTQFAVEVLQVIAYAVSVPVAFTEGFLKAYLSIERVVEEEDGRLRIVPRADATMEDMIRDVDEITAQVDPGAVFNPVVRAKLDAVHQTSSRAMKWDIDALATMDDGQLMEVLRDMQAESERVAGDQAGRDEATDAVRAKIATVRRNIGRFRARGPSETHPHGASAAAADPPAAAPPAG